MTSQHCRTLEMKRRVRNYMITKFDNDTIIRFAARHDSFGLNFTRKNRKSEKNPAFQKSELGILPLNLSENESEKLKSDLFRAEKEIGRLKNLEVELKDARAEIDRFRFSSIKLRNHVT